MKKLSLLLVVSTLMFACAKEKSFETNSSTPVDSTGGGGGTGGGLTTYFIQAKIDSVLKTFDVSPTAKIINNPMAKLLGLAALSSTGEALGLSISFSSGEAEAGKTYTEGATSGNYRVLGTYSKANANTGYVAGASTTPSADLLSITIATKTATEITGSFKGTFYLTDAQGVQTAENKRITEGTFRLPIQ